jgi:GH25 family lysozyme M1 (1,4-beta-N-acetylmuramidase)
LPAYRCLTEQQARAPLLEALDVFDSFIEPLEGRLFLARVEGIDVSQLQNAMNFTTAYNANKRFAFIRASRSDTLPDTNVTTNVNNAKAAGLVVGVYHRALPFSNTADTGAFRDPIVDADSFIASGGAYMGIGYMRPVLDIENGSNKLTTTPQGGYSSLSQWAVAFINRVKAVKNVTPLVYCNTNYAGTYLNSTVVTAAPDIWIANWEEVTYGDPITGNGNPPQGSWGTGSGWDFWQYSSTGTGSTYGAGSATIDLDVFNGSDINLLKQKFVIGAAAIPTLTSPANGATGVSRTGLVLDWANSVGATTYDVYLDNMNTPAVTGLATSQWTVSPAATTGVHSWRVVARGASADDDTWVSSATWSFTVAAIGAPGTPANPNHNGDIVNLSPVTLDWDDSLNASSYDVFLGTSMTPTANVTISQFTTMPTQGTRLWRVVAKNEDGSTNGPQWSYVFDSVAPTATYGSQTPAAGNTFFDFTITYADATSGMNVSTFDDSDVTVTGPNGFSANATFQGVDVAGNGSPRVATYRILAPGGVWNLTDNGTYTVTQNATQVSDVGNTFRPAGTISAFAANVAFAYKLGAVLHAEFDGTATPIALSESGGTFSATRNATTLNFTGVTSISADGTASADQLDILSALPVPLTFNSGLGNDKIRVVSGTYTFDNDVVTTAPNLAIEVLAGASAVFHSSQHLRALTIDGTATVPTNGSRVLVTKSLAITGQLDLVDNDLVWDYTGPSPLGAWSGSDYSGAHGMVRSGQNGGLWNGLGIRSSEQSHLDFRTSFGVAEATDTLSFGAGSTALFGNETVDTTSVLVKFTYAGDANIDGRVNADDYALIDFYSTAPGDNLYSHGDFNFDGTINADDYALIDNNSSSPGDPL